MKKKIIGHRGAAGLELENTETSLKRAVGLNLSAVEFDVRLSSDGKLVVCHDPDLETMAGDKRFIADLQLKELKRIPLLDGSRLLTLHEALKITAEIPVIINTKDNGCARPVLDEIKKFPNSDISVATHKLEELALLRDLDHNLKLYLVEHTKTIEGIHFARQLKLNGIALNYWLLNPLTYHYAHRSALSIYVYTVNSKFLASLLWKFYPSISICTNHPEWFVKKRKRLYRKKRKGISRAGSLRSRRS